MTEEIPCFIASSSSRTLQKQISELKKKYRRIETDLAEAYAEIIRNRKTACHAMHVPGFQGVWKYRCDSSDMNRGQSGGFRIMAYYSEGHRTLHPFCVYTHLQYPKQPSGSDIRQWIKEALGIASQPTEAQSAQVAITCKFCGSILTSDERSAFTDRCAVRRTTDG